MSESPKTRPVRQSRVASLTCDVCSKVFQSASGLSRHKFSHNYETPFACGTCGEQFKRTDELTRHETAHEDKDAFFCYICQEVVEDQDSLVTHIKSAHSVEIVPYVSSSGYVVRSVAVVKEYRLLYRSGKPQTCYVCFEEFESPDKLFDHMGTHTPLELLKGSSDKKLWKSCSSYSGHNGWKKRRKTKTADEAKQDEMTQVCRVCHQMFKSVELLVDHWLSKKGRRGHEGYIGDEGFDTYIFKLEIESGKPLLSCDPCQKALATAEEAASHYTSCHKAPDTEADVAMVTEDKEALQENSAEKSDADQHDQGVLAANNEDALLQSHLATRKGEKMFQCPSCGKLYIRSEDLKQHITHHVADRYKKGCIIEGQEQHGCDLCSEVFSSENDLQFHSIAHRVTPLVIKKYTEDQSTICPICGKALKSATSLPAHIKLHNQGKDFACKVCGMSFRLERNKERHEKIHTGVKEFNCEICGKGLARKAEYLAHVNRHETDPTFNGKAGRKRGTKIVNNKAVLIDNGQFQSESKPPIQESQTIYISADPNHAVGGDKKIIPYKKRKRIKYETMTDGTRMTSLLSPSHFQSENVETQTDTTNPSIQHNIEIIESELRDGVIVEANQDPSAVSAENKEEVIIIVQDPTTGENEVLSIKSFQEGASKLISPNEEILRALESFQITDNVEVVVEEAVMNVKTEIINDTPESIVLQMSNESVVAGKPETAEMGDAVAVKVEPTEPLTEPCEPLETVHTPELENFASADDTTTTLENLELLPTSEPSNMSKDIIDVEPGVPSTTVLSFPITVPVSNNGQVSFIMDETTGVLVPVLPKSDSPLKNAEEIENNFSSNLDTNNSNWDKSKSDISPKLDKIQSKFSENEMTSAQSLVAMETDDQRTAVEALMQMKSPDNVGFRVQGINYQQKSSSENKLEENSPEAEQNPQSSKPSNVSQSEVGEEDQASSENDQPVFNSREDKTVGKICKRPRGRPRKVVHTITRKAKDEISRPRGRPRKVVSLEPVRKSLRNSYGGVSKIIASLVGSKRKGNDDSGDDEEHDDVEEDEDDPDFKASDSSKDFIKCNICKFTVEREELRAHIDETHGTKAYKCGQCDMGYESSIDLQLHMLGHEKADLLKETISRISKDKESLGNDAGIEDTASTVIAHGGRLKQALSSVNIDVESILNSAPAQNANIDEKGDCQKELPKVDSNIVDGREDSMFAGISSREKTCDSITQTDMTGEGKNEPDNPEVDVSVAERRSSRLKTRQTSDGNMSPSKAVSSLQKGNASPSKAVSDDTKDVIERRSPRIRTRRSNEQSPSKQQEQEDDLSGAVSMVTDEEEDHSKSRTDKEVDDISDKDDQDMKSWPCECGLCGHKFSNINQIERHVDTHYKWKSIKCEFCSRSFGRNDEYLRHKISHNGAVGKHKPKRRKFLPQNKKGLFPCHFCKKEFKTYPLRYNHVLCHEIQNLTSKTDQESENVNEPSTSSNKAELACDVCGLVVSGPRHLQRHKLVHSSDKPHHCEDCGKNFIRLSDLKMHRRSQHPNDEEKAQSSDISRECPFCKKTFFVLKTFKNHIKTHRSEKLDGSLKCEECGKVFIKHISLRNHMQKHKDTYRRGMKRSILNSPMMINDVYHCEVCGKQIKNKNNFVRHMKLHTDGKEHVCQVCNKAFARVADLQMHERLHTGERPFLCNICGKGFASNSSLGHHVKMHNQPVEYKFSCTQCEGLFATRKEFNAHVSTCTPKITEIVFIEGVEEVPMETIEYLGQVLQG